MKDIDFDELDRAVSFVLSPKQKAAPKNDTAVEQPSVPTVNLKAEMSNSTEETEPPTVLKADTGEDSNSKSESEKPQPESRPAIVPHRSGRFMDVVSPTTTTVTKQQVTLTTPATTEPQEPSGMAMKATPHLDIKPVQKNTTDTSVEQDNDTTTEKPASAVEDGEPEESKHEELDLAPFKDWDLPPADEQEQPLAKPTETPFLNDAKVEKRPLGAFSDNSTAGTKDDEVVEDNVEESNSKADADKSFHATRLELDEDDDNTTSHLDDIAAAKEITKKPEELNYIPPELGRDVVAVEADTAAQNAKKSGQAAVHSSNMTASSVVSAATAMSIPKQYQEKTEPKSTNSPSLFDTKEYHPPMTKFDDSHSHKHTAAWIIVALLLLIATAAGFGYWLYLQI